MGGLADTLHVLADRAQKQPGEPVRVRLPNKLTISMMIKDGKRDDIFLQLSRAEAMPSLIEWRTVVNLMKCTVISQPVALSTDKNYLKGKVRISPKFIE